MIMQCNDYHSLIVNQVSVAIRTKAIAPIRTAIDATQFSREFRAHAPLGKFLRLKFSEMQSSAFWTL